MDGLLEGYESPDDFAADDIEWQRRVALLATSSSAAHQGCCPRSIGTSGTDESEPISAAASHPVALRHSAGSTAYEAFERTACDVEDIFDGRPERLWAASSSSHSIREPRAALDLPRCSLNFTLSDPPGAPPGVWQTVEDGASLSRRPAQTFSSAESTSAHNSSLSQAEVCARSAAGIEDGSGDSQDCPRQSMPCSDLLVSSSADESVDLGWTTVLIRNFLPGCTRDSLCEFLNELGFEGLYDFVYLPVDFKSWQFFGHAFVNMATHADAVSIKDLFRGLSIQRREPSTWSACDVVWSRPHQGIHELVRKYQDSPIMHASVKDQYKPIILLSGRRIAFPAPTVKLKKPKVRSELQYSTLRARLGSSPTAPVPARGRR